MGLGTGIVRNGIILTGTMLASVQVAHAAEDGTQVEAFNAALIERDAGNLYKAIESLHGILAASPKSHRAKIELAVAYYRALIFEEAERLAQEVLAEPDTPDAVRANIENFLQLIATRRRQAEANEHRLVYEFAFGAGEDDNVNQGPSSDIIDQPAAATPLPPGVTEETDAFATIAARLSHTYTFPGSLQVGERAGQLLWQTQLSLFRKHYQDEKDFNVDVASISTGPAVFVTKAWRAKLNARLEWLRQSDDPLAWFGSLNPSYTRITDFGEFTIDGIVQHREYFGGTNEGREGMRFGAGLSYAQLFMDDRVAFLTGLRAYDQHAEAENREHDVQEVFLGTRVKLPGQYGLHGRYSFKETDYEGNEPVIGKGRKNWEHRLVMGGQYTFRDFGVLDDWVLSANLSRTVNHSNGDVFEFDRTEWSLSASRKFK